MKRPKCIYALSVIAILIGACQPQPPDTDRREGGRIESAHIPEVCSPKVEFGTGPKEIAIPGYGTRAPWHDFGPGSTGR
jgi:hypothetical protein